MSPSMLILILLHCTPSTIVCVCVKNWLPVVLPLCIITSSSSSVFFFSSAYLTSLLFVFYLFFSFISHLPLSACLSISFFLSFPPFPPPSDPLPPLLLSLLCHQGCCSVLRSRLPTLQWGITGGDISPPHSVPSYSGCSLCGTRMLVRGDIRVHTHTFTHWHIHTKTHAHTPTHAQSCGTLLSWHFNVK